MAPLGKVWRSRRWVRWLAVTAAAEVAVVMLVAGAAFGVLGAWPERQADRLKEAATGWQDQPVCEPVPVVEGAAPPAAALHEMALPNSFQIRVSGAECAWIELDIPWSLDLHARWDFVGSPYPEFRVEQVWAAKDLDAPWTLTAVGPGGVTVVEGEMRLQKSED